MKEQLESFHLNGHTTGFHPQTRMFEALQIIIIIIIMIIIIIIIIISIYIAPYPSAHGALQRNSNI